MPARAEFHEMANASSPGIDLKVISFEAVGFFSYVRADDKNEGGRLTKICNKLNDEVGMLSGEEFHIFQDRKDILWGQEWAKRIEESVNASTFLIPVITPRFFKSESCRNELELFLEREKELSRSDLI